MKLITDINDQELLDNLKYRQAMLIEIDRLTRKYLELSQQPSSNNIEGFKDGILFALCLKSELVPELIRKNANEDCR